jgi:hypothetical protein
LVTTVQYPILKKTVIIHVFDKSNEEEGAALERTADFAIEKVQVEIPE